MTIVIVISVALETSIPQLAAMSLVVSLYQTSIQLVVCIILIQCHVIAPFRISSLAPGQAIRLGTFTVVEDIAAVDGGQGSDFRRLLDARYKESAGIPLLMARFRY